MFFAMVPYFLDFHESIRFSKTLSEYEEQSYPTEKITIAFLDPTKKKRASQGIFYINYFRNIISKYLRMYWKYAKGMFHEYSANIYFPGR